MSTRKLTAKKLDLVQYGKLLATFVPRPIETEEERKRVSAVIKEMLNKDLTVEEEVLFQLLVKLVTEYDDQLVPIPDASPAMMLQYLMKNAGLRQVDLAKILNTSRGGVSSIVGGKRAVSKAQAKILADRFMVSVEAFL